MRACYQCLQDTTKQVGYYASTLSPVRRCLACDVVILARVCYLGWCCICLKCFTYTYYFHEARVIYFSYSLNSHRIKLNSVYFGRSCGYLTISIVATMQVNLYHHGLYHSYWNRSPNSLHLLCNHRLSIFECMIMCCRTNFRGASAYFASAISS